MLPENETLAEARRHMAVCNSCRYCESYCAVFPAMTMRREFSAGDLTHLANLCHGCKGCYHACQYGPPHEFGIISQQPSRKSARNPTRITPGRAPWVRCLNAMARW